MCWARSLALGLALAVTGCASVRQTVNYQVAAGLEAQLDEGRQALRHTAPGALVYTTAPAGSGVVDVSIAGVTDHDDQNALLQALQVRHDERARAWSELQVRFYDTTQPAPQSPLGFEYRDLLRTEKIPGN